MNKAEKIAAILAITQVFKYYGAPSAFCPVIAMALGAVLQYVEHPTANGVIEGVIIGAVATGGFGSVKGAAQFFTNPTAKTPATDSLEADDDRGV